MMPKYILDVLGDPEKANKLGYGVCLVAGAATIGVWAYLCIKYPF